MKKIFSLIPFVIFLITFITLNLYYPDAKADVKNDFALFSVFIALIFSFFTFKSGTSINERVSTFIRGTAQETTLHMCFIFLFSTMLSYALYTTGGSQAAVDLALYFMPQSFILPGIFFASSIFSLSLGTSMGTIVTFMPMFYQLTQSLGVSTELIAGVVVGGSMLGDNLSLLSDTTIAATKVTGAEPYEKLKENLKIAIPAALITVAILLYINHTMITIKPPIFLPEVSILNFLKISPYLLTFILSLLGLDTLLGLVLGVLFSCSIGLYLDKINFKDTLTIFDAGFYQSKGTVGIFILVLLLSGLSQIVKYNGGINYILEFLNKKQKSITRTKFEILFLVLFINAIIAINTISILLAGPIAKKIAGKKISYAKNATILDIGACVSQGILPYTPQILLAATICQISPLAIIPYLIYPYILFIALISNLLFIKP